MLVTVKVNPCRKTCLCVMSSSVRTIDTNIIGRQCERFERESRSQNDETRVCEEVCYEFRINLL